MSLNLPMGAQMGVLVVKCPQTGKMFSTGIQADAETFQNLPQVQTRSKCPHCGLDHLWRQRDAVLSDGLPPSEWIENRKRPFDDVS
jgi:hypothetical protein